MARFLLHREYRSVARPNERTIGSVPMSTTQHDQRPHRHHRRMRPGRLFWIVGLAVGVLVGAVVAVSLAEVTDNGTPPALSS